jgi:hypothetical protein
MAREEGWLQLERSDMCLQLNMATIPKGGFASAVLEDMQYMIMTTSTNAQDEKMRDVPFPGNRKVMATIETCSAMVCENQLDGSLPCQNGVANNLQTCSRSIDTGISQPEQAPPRPKLPFAPPDDFEGAHSSHIEGASPRYVYVHSPLPKAEYFNLDAYAEDHIGGKDFIPHLRTENETSTG